jgi:dynein heavy chain, axonemal
LVGAFNNTGTCRYAPCGAHAAVLFFAIADLAALDPMYQYSLSWFVHLFKTSIAAAATSEDIEKRLQAITAHFTYALYCNVCRSLFQKDKLLFAFLLCSRIRESRGEADPSEWLFLLTGDVANGSRAAANPAPEWLPERAWREACRLSKLAAFAGLADSLAESPAEWREVHDAAAPHAARLPGHLDGALSPFQKLCVVRALRPDGVARAVAAFVARDMGRQYVEPPPFSLGACYADSAPTTPLLFVLSAGSDPTAALLQFAEEHGMGARLHAISLGAPSASLCP